MPSLAQEAIEAALRGDWAKALKINEGLTRDNQKDIEALNRLAQAAIGLGKISKAKRTYQTVLKYDKYNPIALKNLERLNLAKINCDQKPLAPTEGTDVFLEEPGKTKVIGLVNLATPQILSTLQTGSRVCLTLKKHGVVVVDSSGNYLGALPDDIGRRLEAFIKAGCEYRVFLRTVSKNSLAVFIRECKKPTRLENQPSFISNGGFGNNNFRHLRLEEAGSLETPPTSGEERPPQELEE